MALFTTLTSSTTTENNDTLTTSTTNNNNNNSTTSATTPPTAVQLYTTKSFNFLLNSISNHSQHSTHENGTTTTTDTLSTEETSTTPGTTPGGSPMPRHSKSGIKHQQEQTKHPFAVLSYQAVQVPDSNNSTNTNKKEDEAVALPLGLRKTSSIKQQHLKPNLGIWDCRVLVTREESSSSSSSSSLVNKLLSSVVGGDVKNNNNVVDTFVLAVDLSDSRLVQGAVCSMLNAIIAHLEDSKSENSEGSTTLSALKSCTFGSASTPSIIPTNQDNNNDKSINLLLCALVPPSIPTKTPTYKEKQSQNLILYHLHKFALEVNCTLCFVRPFVERKEVMKEDGVKDVHQEEVGVESFGGGMVGTVSVAELAGIVRKLSAGGVASLVENSDDEEEEEDDDDEKKEESKEEENKKQEEEEEKKIPKNVTPQAIYTPKSHDPDILKGVYLRNASCEGEWDASTDDLGKALLPPPSSSNNNNNTLANSNVNQAGDHEWLNKLYQSVGVVAPDARDGSDGVSGGTTLGDKSFISPAAKGKKKGGVAGSTTKKKGGAAGKESGDTQAFFQNLLGNK